MKVIFVAAFIFLVAASVWYAVTHLPRSAPVDTAPPVPQSAAAPTRAELNLELGQWECQYECGRARWAIKTLSDWQADQVRIDSVVETTVEALAALSMPETWPDEQRIGAVERTVFRLTGDIVEWSIQADRDVHIVIASPERPYVTMIAEIPDPPCWGACESGVAPTYYRLQQVFMERLCNPDCSRRNRLAVPVRARFTGVGFFDRPHTTTGAAPNYIELHPLLDLEFLNSVVP